MDLFFIPGDWKSSLNGIYTTSGEGRFVENYRYIVTLQATGILVSISRMPAGWTNDYDGSPQQSWWRR